MTQMSVVHIRNQTRNCCLLYDRLSGDYFVCHSVI